MICSQSELKNLIYNSGIGSNIDVGICEEISQAVAKLESFNINASQEALNCFKNPTYRKTKIHVSKNSIGFRIFKLTPYRHTIIRYYFR